MPNYDDQLWITNDNELWTVKDDFIWIPYISGDGLITFILKDIQYHHNAESNRYGFVCLNQKYSITASNNKYCFVCKDIEDWFQGV